MSTKKTYKVKLFEGDTETSYEGYEEQEVEFLVDKYGYITSNERVTFNEMPLEVDDETRIITHIKIQDIDTGIGVLRNLSKVLTNKGTERKTPRFEKGEIKTRKRLGM